MDAAKRKLVEVFIDTDSDSESHTSSEVEVTVVSDEAAGAEEKVGVVSDGEDLDMVSPELSAEEGKFADSRINKCAKVST